MKNDNIVEYRIWSGIKQRCHNKNNKDYIYYGERGISICDRWKNGFKYFLEDVGKRPSIKHSLDRIDNNGNYCKENCRWVLYEVQRMNRRDSIFVSINKVQIPFFELAKIFNIKRKTLYLRLYRSKWSLSKALNK
jgi:hypothetical protein